MKNGIPHPSVRTKGVAVPDFTVKQYGTDTSGRPIFMTAFMADWWEAVVRELGFRPTIVQGAWMVRAGGGATESAGYHDGGGCLDIRTWDRTQTQVEAIIRATRWTGAGSWVRDKTPRRGGMDPHIHLVLGSDDGLSGGAAWQWLNYINGGDGLSSGGRDYHPRPNPLVTEPPEDDMPLTDEDVQRVARAVRAELAEGDRVRYQRLRDQIKRMAKSTRERDKALADQLEALVEDEPEP